jgi:hypothetical protein
VSTRTLLTAVVCYETWSLTLREKCRLMVFGNMVLRKIFEHSREKVTKGCRNMQNEELHSYSPPYIFRMCDFESGNSTYLSCSDAVWRSGGVPTFWRVLMSPSSA